VSAGKDEVDVDITPVSRPSLSALALKVTWFSYGTLLLQQVLDAAVTQAPWIVWSVKLLPLLLFLPGMLKRNPRSFIWLCFMCLGYFLVLVPRWFADSPDGLAIAGTVAVVILFTAAMMYVRWHASEQRNAHTENP